MASEVEKESAVLASVRETKASEEEEFCERDCCLKSQEQMQKTLAMDGVTDCRGGERSAMLGACC